MTFYWAAYSIIERSHSSSIVHVCILLLVDILVVLFCDNFISLRLVVDEIKELKIFFFFPPLSSTLEL